MDKADVTRRPYSIHVPPKPEAVGQPVVYKATLGQINAARRRNALKQVRELIREFQFTLDEIERGE